jgi:hypothetical protein
MACEVFQSLLEADKFPCTGDEDVAVAIAMTGEVPEKAMAVLSPDEPPKLFGALYG